MDQIRLRADKLSSLVWVIIKMLEDDSIWTDRKLDNVIRFPRIGNFIDDRTPPPRQDENDDSPLALLLAAAATRRDLLEIDNQVSDHRIVDSRMEIPPHLALGIDLPGKLIALYDKDRIFFLSRSWSLSLISSS